MADYIRRLVSGDKARFKDAHLNLELDLVYLTDHIIIMGYPAAGFERWYRNPREDTKKFLDHRHHKDYWVFNFCPIRENSYDASFFDGRVSRYPFPDHHAPPLAIMPLVAREMRAWLNGSSDRVAVLHCKAGKGRSGTMACAYLLSLDDSPSPPKLQRSYTQKQWARLRADAAMDAVPADDDDKPTLPSSATDSPASTDSLKLESVLDLHTARRMKVNMKASPSTTPPHNQKQKQKQGVSIPSQRRFLYYWALVLAHAAPPHFWALPSLPLPRPRVRLTHITLRMRPASAAKTGLVHAASAVLARAGIGRGQGAGDAHVWASLARYDDEFVGALEAWELRTRDTEAEHMGWRAVGEEGRIFDEGGRWDRGKMVRRFTRMGAVGAGAVVKGARDDEGRGEKIDIFTLRSLSKKWEDTFREEIPDSTAEPEGTSEVDEEKVPASEASSVYESAKEKETEQEYHPQGVILDAGREVRIKLYMGQVPMAWLWFIPTFHMLPASESASTTLCLTRKELDFPLGLGSGIVDVAVGMEWVGLGSGMGEEGGREGIQPLGTRPDEEGGGTEGVETEGVVAAAAASVDLGVGGVREIVEVAQAAGDK
ncbi:hypothetical protein D9615_005022 [Tricholomella constricta]|uniref:phosphatidylinositol-3,4,5-trisphosphate 3-phosphatase n=1 Tax=Tricholomella constricta TaxID=117010 RepID=A0A8H5M798_9AGAR|nr:hypothetical protein D9615_005022 [Tricholomella constricta]